MTINIQWFDNTQRAVLIAFNTAWTWEQFCVALAQVDILLDTAPRQLDLIFDFSIGCHVVPAKAIRYLRRINTWAHPKRKRIILVGAKHYTRTFEYILNLAQSRLEPDLVLVDTVNQALDVTESRT